MQTPIKLKTQIGTLEVLPYDPNVDYRCKRADAGWEYGVRFNAARNIITCFLKDDLTYERLLHVVCNVASSGSFANVTFDDTLSAIIAAFAVLYPDHLQSKTPKPEYVGDWYQANAAKMLHSDPAGFGQYAAWTLRDFWADCDNPELLADVLQVEVTDVNSLYTLKRLLVAYSLEALNKVPGAHGCVESLKSRSKGRDIAEVIASKAQAALTACASNGELDKYWAEIAVLESLTTPDIRATIVAVTDLVIAQTTGRAALNQMHTYLLSTIKEQFTPFK